MKIVLVGPAKPYRGGIAHFSDEFAQALRHRGHEVTIETFRRQYPSFVFPGTSQLDGDLNDLPEGTLAEIDSINPISWIAAGRRIRNLKPDLVLFAYWLPFFAGVYSIVALIARRRGTHVAALVHNALPHEKALGDRLLSRVFFDRCDSLLTLSSAVAADIVSMGMSRKVIEAGHPVYTHFGGEIKTNEAREALGIAPESRVILFFGFVRRYKGLDILIEALPRIVEAYPDTVLLVAGEFYEGEEDIRQRVAGSGLTDYVRFETRYIPDEHVKTHFSAADLLVQPYRSATQSGVAHIAFHFACPIVVTDVGGLSETVPDGEAGLVVPPENPAAIADAVIRFFDDAALREHLREGARKQRGAFSWDKLSEVVERIAGGLPPNESPD